MILASSTALKEVRKEKEITMMVKRRKEIAKAREKINNTRENKENQEITELNLVLKHKLMMTMMNSQLLAKSNQELKRDNKTLIVTAMMSQEVEEVDLEEPEFKEVVKEEEVVSLKILPKDKIEISDFNIKKSHRHQLIF